MAPPPDDHRPHDAAALAYRLLTEHDPTIVVQRGSATDAELQRLLDEIDALCVRLGTRCRIRIDEGEIDEGEH